MMVATGVRMNENALYPEPSATVVPRPRACPATMTGASRNSNPGGAVELGRGRIDGGPVPVPDRQREPRAVPQVAVGVPPMTCMGHPVTACRTIRPERTAGSPSPARASRRSTPRCLSSPPAVLCHATPARPRADNSLLQLRSKRLVTAPLRQSKTWPRSAPRCSDPYRQNHETRSRRRLRTPFPTGG